MKSPILYFLAILLNSSSVLFAQQGNHVFTTGEAANYGSIDLATPGGQTWSTDRLALPGYFSTIFGAIYTGASDAANINGYVKKYGNEAYTFPVGTGTDLRTLTMDNSAGLATDAYAVAWIVGDPSGNLDPTAPNAGPHPLNAVPPDIVTVSPVGQWDWQAGDAGNLGAGTTGTGAGIPISVSIPDMTLFATGPALRLVGWNGTMWVNLSGTTGAASNTENSLLSGTMIAGITAVAIGSTEDVLPVKLMIFNLKEEKNCTVVALWTVTEEINMNRYELEQSIDGIHYNNASVINSKNSSGLTTYNSHVSQKPGTNYYRLKMIDKDARSEYSGIVSLRTNCNMADHMTLYPTLVTGINSELTLEYSQQYTGKARIVVTNNVGQRLMILPMILTGELNNIKINTGSLKAGMYYLSVTDEQGNRIGTPQKFIKQ